LVIQVIGESTVGSTPEENAASLTREQLYDLVWKEPMLRVGERLGVSSSNMARLCTELRVPRPPRGYWSKLEFGKAPERPALPDSKPGDVTEWRPGDFIGVSERMAGRRARSGVPANDAKPTTPVDAVRRRPRQAREVEQFHPLLVGVKPFFEKTRDSETGILRPFKRLLADILSSKEGLDNAIGAADCLFQALTSRGHRVTIAPVGLQLRRTEVDLRETPRKNHYVQSAWSPERPTLVYIGDVPIGLTLFEMTEATEMQYVGNSTYVPVNTLTPTQRRQYDRSNYWTTTKERASGRLRLQAYCPSWRVDWVQQWSETELGQFLSMVPSIVQELEAAGPKLAALLEAARIKAEEEHRKWEEEARRRREAEARALQEKRHKDAREDLIAAIDAWNEARVIAAYFAEAERAARQLDAAESQQLLNRISLAREVLGETKPLELLLRWKAPNERD
jgi:hypothetical protein